MIRKHARVRSANICRNHWASLKAIVWLYTGKYNKMNNVLTLFKAAVSQWHKDAEVMPCFDI